MRFLKIAMLGLSAVIALILISGLFMRSTWEVERSITIQAKPETVQTLVGDLRRWPEWMPWSKERDPSAEFTFSGEGVGAEMRWTGKKFGKSSLVLTAIDGRSGVGYDMRFAGREEPGHGTLRLEPVGTGAATTVVWHETGDVGWNPLNRFMVRLIESALARDFTLGLERLKKKAEASG